MIGCVAGVAEPEKVGILWEVDGTVEIPPVVYDSLVIMTTDDGTVRALKRRNGARIWETRLRFPSYTGAMLRRDTIILIPAGDLVALDVRTGAELWRYRGAASSTGVLPAVLVGDTVFVPGFIGGDAAAVDVRTGRPFWQNQLGGSIAQPLVTNSMVVYPRRDAPGFGGGLVGLDRLTGRESWRRPLNADGSRDEVLAAGAVVGDIAYMGSQKGILFAYRVSDGSIVWRDTSGARVSNLRYATRPLIRGDAVIFMSEAGLLRALDRGTGALLWTTVMGGGGLTVDLQECAPYLCYANGRVFVGDSMGRTVWTMGGGENGVVISSNLTVDGDGVLYVGMYRNNQGRFAAIRPPIRLGATQ